MRDKKIYVKDYFPSIKFFRDRKSYHNFVEKINCLEIKDLYKELAFEKFVIDNPKTYFLSKSKQSKDFFLYLDKSMQRSNFYSLGSWIHLPWSNNLLHVLTQNEYFDLRTTRNRDLINKDDQFKLYNKKIAIAGLSVGLNVLLSFIRYGIGNYYKIADFDSVALSNLNRSLYNISDIGKNKCEVVASKIFEIDPFIKVKLFFNGLNNELLDEFMSGIDLIVDAFDNFNLKIKLRELAKRKKIPVISGFDVEKGTLLIVERYDTEPNLDISLFLNNYNENLLYKNKITQQEKTNLFINIIGRQYHSDLMLDSALKVGTSLTGYPQLIIATFLASAAFVLVAEGILLETNLSSLRKFIPLAKMIR